MGELNWGLIAYVAWGLFSAELAHRKLGAGWVQQVWCAVLWPVMWLGMAIGFARAMRRMHNHRGRQ